ncbi:MAG: Beta propeller domain protein [Candidatus Roizmanbacteria bacterium GW2011_GWA2_36_23]|uniref:Beta propeller domain protein n=1 Tax=Candidatus Roizmanbacteria bacterium GW2011_GWA2_36_23 TaxID=1618480 RepID=A0A0G0E8Q4_9BACT|nr:MAG: Beta propeller domain protein [Candidatus Roizmanbacteria bacterium GW2011_GWA2_36_23]
MKQSNAGNIIKAIIASIVIVILAATALSTLLLFSKNKPQKLSSTKFNSFEKFTSESQFKEYLQKAAKNQSRESSLMMKGLRPEAAPTTTSDLDQSYQTGEPGRVSQTNVQVIGIDEPDIVKTNGTDLYFAGFNNRIYEEPIPDTFPNKMIMPPDIIANLVKSFRIFPVSELSTNATIKNYGDLLLYKTTLVIFDEQGNNSRRGIYGYDVSNPTKPKESWRINYKDNTYKIQARLYDKKIYLVTVTNSEINKPCPIVLFTRDNNPLSIRCTDIYHPVMPVSTDSIYTVSKIDTRTGEVEKTVSFVGSSQESVLYMSRENLYVSYSFASDYLPIFNDFINENTDIFPLSLAQKLQKLQTYDISENAKMVEFETLLGNYLNGLDSDKRLTLENNLNNRVKAYLTKRNRDLEKTGIVKININNFAIDALGEIPGKPLNQYSMDEYKNHLRIATTVGSNNLFWRFGSNTNQTVNDVYVLNNDLKISGSVLNLGKNERIYSARFIQDRGYVVTFRQTDPFYIIDLSNPNNPQLSGELKIPGYSSYLHPLTSNIILGVGKENQQVKLSLFDVSNASSPQEIDKFLMDEYWSEIIDNPRAFLVDEQFKIFFIPGSKGGYVFSYENNKLSLTKAFEGIQTKRAVYVNNYLYIITEQGIIVVDEKTWDRVKELSF